MVERWILARVRNRQFFSLAQQALGLGNDFAQARLAFKTHGKECGEEEALPES